MVATNTADAVEREIAWLSVPGTDGLPALLVSNGGPWDSIGRYPRTPYQERRTVYVMRHRIAQKKFAAQRVMATYPFRLVLWWPILALDGSAEEEGIAFDEAIDLILQRALGPLGDKTHGGRFLSVGEGPALAEVDFTDVDQTVPALNGFRAEVTYSADDREINA